MALNTNYGKVSYTIINESKEYTFNFKIYEESDVRVYVRAEGEIPNDNHDILQTFEYSVTIDGDNGGLITLVDTPPLQGNIVMLRNLPLDREFNYTPNGGIYSHDLNEDQDYQTYLVQDQRTHRHSSLSFAKSAWGADFEPKVNQIIPNGYLKIKADGSGIEMDTTVSENAAIVADSIESVNTVADDIVNVNRVAVDTVNVNKTGDDIDSVNLVAEDISHVNTNAANISHIRACGSFIDDIVTVSTDIISVIRTGDNIADIISVNTNETNINTVSTDIDNVNQVGNNIDDVIATGSNETNINTVADNIVEVVNVSDNMATVSETMNGVNDFNGIYYRSLSQAPTITSHPTLTVGDMYFNNIDDMMKVYTTDNEWQDVSPTVSNIEGVGLPYDINVLYSIATAGQTVFSAPSTETDLIIVNINGKTLSESDYTSDGSNITLNVGASLNDDVIVQVITTTTVYHEIISTDSQTVYSITYSSSSFINVFLNGRLLSTDTYTLTSNTVTLNSGATSGDILTLTEAEVAEGSSKTEYVAAANQTTFDVTYNVGTNSDDVLAVYINGRLLPSSEYTADTGTNVILTVSTTLNDSIVITKMVSEEAEPIETYGVYSKPQVDEMLELKADKTTLQGIVQMDSVIDASIPLVTVEPTTDTDIPAMNISITPLYTDSKFKITVRFSAKVSDQTDYNFVLNLNRDGVRVNNATTNDTGLCSFGDNDVGAYEMATVSFTTLDKQTNVVGTPINYQLTIRSNDDETEDRRIYPNQGQGLRGVSEIIVEEIK